MDDAARRREKMNAPLRCLLLACASAACAEAPPEAEIPWQVRGELQIVHLDEQRALPLIARFTDDATGAGAELRRLLADGTATLTAHLVVNTQHEVAGEAWQGRNIRYGIEFSPFDPGTIPVSKPGKAPESVHYPATAFNNRDAGTAFRFDPYISSDGRFATVSVNVNAVDYSGDQRFENGVQADGTKLHFEMPVFHSRRNIVQALVRTGRPVLIGCCKHTGQSHLIELHMLTTHARLPDAPQPDPLPEVPLSQERIELHRFIVPEKDALRMRSSLLDPAKIDPAFVSLLDAVKSGQCELGNILSVPVRTGIQTLSTTIREVRFASDSFPSPCFAPQEVVRAMALSLAAPNPPTVFEHRDVGESLELEPIFHSETGSVDVYLQSTACRFHGFHRWATGRDPQTQTVGTYKYEPDFTQVKTISLISLPDRQRMLLRFQKLPAPDGRVEITLIRAVSERFSPDTKP